jgi:(E)-4-hydroxy-3-methylbut-2-enyl-diphosphate synthase
MIAVREVNMRRQSRKVICNNVEIGGGSPISIQSMTNTDTRNIKATIHQIKTLTEAGCQIIRCAVPDMEAAEAIKAIKNAIDIPLVADIHFDYRLALEAIKSGADKIRINPGNIGNRDRVLSVVRAAKDRNIPIRIGVNSGSLEKDILVKHAGVTAEGLVESTLRNIKLIEEMDFYDLVVSIKSSHVRLNYDAHILIADKMNYPLHIGITEAGTLEHGKVKSAVGIGALLMAGIGDTIRVSLTGEPLHEISYAREILKAAGIRQEGINFISCPTCGRCSVDLSRIASEIELKLQTIKIKRPITIAVMGCEVNGPGEAKEADIGIAFGKGKALLFKKGIIVKTLSADQVDHELIGEIENLLAHL